MSIASPEPALFTREGGGLDCAFPGILVRPPESYYDIDHITRKARLAEYAGRLILAADQIMSGDEDAVHVPKLIEVTQTDTTPYREQWLPNRPTVAAIKRSNAQGLGRLARHLAYEVVSALTQPLCTFSFDAPGVTHFLEPAASWRIGNQLPYGQYGNEERKGRHWQNTVAKLVLCDGGDLLFGVYRNNDRPAFTAEQLRAQLLKTEEEHHLRVPEEQPEVIPTLKLVRAHGKEDGPSHLDLGAAQTALATYAEANGLTYKRLGPAPNGALSWLLADDRAALAVVARVNLFGRAGEQEAYISEDEPGTYSLRTEQGALANGGINETVITARPGVQRNGALFGIDQALHALPLKHSDAAHRLAGAVTTLHDVLTTA